MITLIEDTRNKPGKHDLKGQYFEDHGIKVVRSKLPAADYALLTDMSRVVDSKRSLGELVGNLIQDHERFKREAVFCQENGIEFFVLVEEFGMRTLEDVLKWKNPRLRYWKKVMWHHKNNRWLSVKVSKMPPTSNETLYRIMQTFTEKYSCNFEFCDPADAGAKVIEILTRGKDIG